MILIQSSCGEEVALGHSRSELTPSLDCAQSLTEAAAECSVELSKESFIERDETFMKGSELHNVGTT